MPQVEPPQEQPSTPYTPAMPAQGPLILDKMAGMNTSPDRMGVSDDQLFWIDGFMPLDDNNLRTLPGVGPQLYNAPPGTTIIYFDFFNIASSPKCAVFLSNGKVDQFDTDTLAVTQIAPPGTVLVPFINNIGTTQYGNQYLIFVCRQNDGYFIWDGAVLYVPGGPAPGGGLMPLGLHGSAVEIYQDRVWIANDATIIFSAPSSVSDFTGGSGGGSFTSNDSFLKVLFERVVSVNGFLYQIGDSSVNYISGVQTTGSPPVTTFTNQNADAQVGSPYPASVEVFGRNILMANSFGVHVIYGSEVKKVSKPLDGVYSSVASFAGFQLSSGQATIFGRRCWCVLVPIIDPISGLLRNKLMMWDGDKRWWASEQDVASIIFIRHQEINSTFTLWGTDGAIIRRYFAVGSFGFQKNLLSKLWSRPGWFMTGKAGGMLWGCIKYNFVDSAIVVRVESETGLAFAQSLPLPLPGAAGYNVFDPQSFVQPGKLIGMFVSTTASDITINTLGIDIQITEYRG